MEQAFQTLQERWEGTVFRLTKLIPNVCEKKTPQYGVTQEKKPATDLESVHKASQLNFCSSGTFTIMGLYQK